MTKKQDLEKTDKIHTQIESLYNEIGILSKKIPNAPLNKFKIKYINSTLRDANQILTEKNKPFTDFSTFLEDDLPTNSDVVMILAQYLKTMDENF